MTRFAFITISLSLAACGGSDFSGFDNPGGTGGAGGAASPDASTAGSSGSGGSSTGSGGSAGSVSQGGSSGAIGTGGAPGTGGNSGTSSTGGGPGTGGNAGSVADAGTKDAAPPIDSGSGPACKIDSDCRLSDTCCGCLALGPNDKAPVCSILCIQSACAAQQIHGTRCSQGRCVVAPECDSKNVTCKVLPGECRAGEVHSVKGDCWGGCVPASSCRTVTDCKACESDAYLCARQETQLGSVYRCVDVPAQCGNNVTCSCAGPAACLPPFGSCNASMSGKQLNCSCPNC